MHVTREGQKIQIHANTGVDVTVKNNVLHEIVVSEDATHLEYFHTQLGVVLNQAKEDRAGLII
jgi:hypothetical protein